MKNLHSRLKANDGAMDLALQSFAGILEKEGIHLRYREIRSVREKLISTGGEGFHGELSPWESFYLDKLKIEKRKGDFLGGRLAGKDAVRNIMQKMRPINDTLADLSHRDFDIRRMDSGEPVLFIDDRITEIHISITHSGETALSITGSKKDFRGIGIDMEKIERRDDSFMEIAFTGEELLRLAGTKDDGEKWDICSTARYWTIKEAVMKSIASGLNLNLKDIMINEDDAGAVTVSMKNSAEKKFIETGGSGPYIKSARAGNYFITAAWIRTAAHR